MSNTWSDYLSFFSQNKTMPELNTSVSGTVRQSLGLLEFFLNFLSIFLSLLHSHFFHHSSYSTLPFCIWLYTFTAPLKKEYTLQPVTVSQSVNWKSRIFMWSTTKMVDSQRRNAGLCTINHSNALNIGSLRYIYIYTHTHTHIYIYTGCFTTLGHNCRRWFPRSSWSKTFI